MPLAFEERRGSCTRRRASFCLPLVKAHVATTEIGIVITRQRAATMITYCPTCANMLLGERLLLIAPLAGGNAGQGQKGRGGCVCRWLLGVVNTRPLPSPSPAVELTDYTKELRYYCQTCPYVYLIDKKVRRRRLAVCMVADPPRRSAGMRSSSSSSAQSRNPFPVRPAQITKKAPLVKKQVDDVLGGEDAWKNVAQAEGGFFGRQAG